ncbi:diaminopimelate epimerase [Neolewinella antarctica]|uniref:Diaminopimelate epimerase n=1 Tax=Neolewinella antarctica TaxID=442734 RepID=A0ABX0X6V0_9BACT|nr:diaminopimelate epimerase [Neolewinella antarctica]NJC24748.1 diaminopimelate epimerase [Neolewinella antarctica]
MATHEFYKYEGAGNDFIIIDDRANTLHEAFDQRRIAHFCDRHFGIGGDGMMFLRSHPEYDFEMIYYNADGAPSSMCGNGGRCIVRFAANLGIERECYNFLAVDGPHRAKLLKNGWVSLGMTDVKDWSINDEGAFVMDTGSPHYVQFGRDPATVDVVQQGRAIRNSPAYAVEGINVNFVLRESNILRISTYERGVEDETLACGTGVTAAAISAAELDGVGPDESFRYAVVAKGGELAVRGKKTERGYADLWLEGPATYVFKGEI